MMLSFLVEGHVIIIRDADKSYEFQSNVTSMTILSLSGGNVIIIRYTDKSGKLQSMAIHRTLDILYGLT